MTRETFNEAHAILVKIEKLNQIMARIKGEFHEFEYDKQIKDLIGNDIMLLIDNKIGWLQKDFANL